MKALLQFLKKHWLSFSAYAVYLLLSGRVIIVSLDFEKMRSELQGKGGGICVQGLVFAQILFMIISIALALTTFGVMMIRKRDHRYYSCLLALVLLTVIITLTI
ncbi:hypothetical protein C8P68_101454 [Mucilaginibacter yixingensis]|uniref:Uncharacterized protein n=1 Tax=Mucilaginibacter yixingensis TaxID=1295612 RepID=A0A2T5JFK7_9SPHI|nr:hypothetical protein C8P68_101454 [Mucilaginibacter yixingensis]